MSSLKKILFKAAENGDLNIINNMVKKGGSNLNDILQYSIKINKLILLIIY